ncbi:flagellar hook-length control protein FliK [Salinimonas iocasae]|uniref:Flagellar hook-length control protein FliK n=1 Tax=Salinimonas iocasae TaxID=2572577 RepID=A0A5B7YG98_9ALTE|nr:flagellar hook-length control protein FliK [Salinimonas iocasae]QCZ94360.1 flagellar hook-length control protein FliK [Salinimonas iocasae]
MSANIHTFVFVADNLSMISASLLHSVSQALSAGSAQALPRVRSGEITQANLSMTDGKIQLTLSGQTLTVMPVKDASLRLPEGKVRLARDSAQTAVILETLSASVSAPAPKGALSSKAFTALVKYSLPVLANPLSAPASVVRGNDGAFRLTLRNGAVDIPLPPALNATVTGHKEVQVTLRENGQGLTLAAPSGSPVPIKLSRQNQSLLSAALIQQNLTTGVQLSRAPLPLLEAMKIPVPENIHNASSLLIKTGINETLVTIEQLKPTARIQLPANLASLVDKSPNKGVLSKLQLPEFQVRISTPSPTQTVKSTQHLSDIGNIKGLAQKLLQHTGSTNQALKELLTILRSASPSSQSQPEIKRIVEQLSFSNSEAQVKKEEAEHTKSTSAPDNPKHTVPSPDQISRFAQSVLQPVSPSLISQPAPTNSFNSALVSLFQLVLSGRTSHSPGNTSAAAYSQLLSQSSKPKRISGTAATPMRFTNELASVDRQAGLLNPLKTLLANHQSVFLSNIESRSQGNEQLYFCLPFRSEYCTKPPEVLIKREAEEDNNETEGARAAKTWSLTMKLEAGESGEVLAKTKISNETINLNLYASTPMLLDKIEQTLPMLINRLSASGLVVESAHAQQGKVPESLQHSPYQVFEVTA